jgi:RNA polymerase sigma factor (sigma-70 family)
LGKEEEALIAQCKKGDIKSYELLYNRYSLAMYHTCLRVVNIGADAEDILQDAFMDAFTNLHKIRQAEAFSGWLKRIVIHKAINHVKRHRQTWVELEESHADDMTTEEMIDENEFESQLTAINEALNQLPDKYRMVINLHVFEQMSFEEIAVLVEMPSGTIRSQYMRGRQKILNTISRRIG